MDQWWSSGGPSHSNERTIAILLYKVLYTAMEGYARDDMCRGSPCIASCCHACQHEDSSADDAS